MTRSVASQQRLYVCERTTRGNRFRFCSCFANCGLIVCSVTGLNGVLFRFRVLCEMLSGVIERRRRGVCCRRGAVRCRRDVAERSARLRLCQGTLRLIAFRTVSRSRRLCLVLMTTMSCVCRRCCCKRIRRRRRRTTTSRRRRRPSRGPFCLAVLRSSSVLVGVIRIVSRFSLRRSSASTSATPASASSMSRTCLSFFKSKNRLFRHGMFLICCRHLSEWR